jgi:hypothetical protein
MKILEPGHVYELKNLDSEGTQTLSFMLQNKAVHSTL